MDEHLFSSGISTSMRTAAPFLSINKKNETLQNNNNNIIQKNMLTVSKNESNTHIKTNVFYGTQYTPFYSLTVTFIEKNPNIDAQKYAKTYIIDDNHLEKLQTDKMSFVFVNKEKIYPYCKINKNNKTKLITLLNYLYNYNTTFTYCTFKNGDEYDLRKCNINILPKPQISNNLINNLSNPDEMVIDYIEGHRNSYGPFAYQTKNPIWKIRNKTTNEEYYYMFCENDTLCKLCEKSLQAILNFENEYVINKKKITWHVHSINKYIYSNVLKLDKTKMLNIYGKNVLNTDLDDNITTNQDDVEDNVDEVNDNNSNNIMEKRFMIHQVITRCFGNGKGTGNISVDHLNRIKSDNTFDNLSLASVEQQNNNAKGVIKGTKRERQYIARTLPEGMSHEMMPKYITYEEETYKTKTGSSTRNFFRVTFPDPHNRGKFIEQTSSKSNTVLWQDKLEQAKQILHNLETGEEDVNKGVTGKKRSNDLNLPKFVTICKKSGRNTSSLIYRDKIKGITASIVLPNTEYIMVEELNKLLTVVQKKNPDITAFVYK